MKNKDSKKTKLGRLIIGIGSVLFIVFLWLKNNIITIYITMPKEQAIPLVATTVAVSLIKVTVLSGGVLLLKWIVNKLTK